MTLAVVAFALSQDPDFGFPIASVRAVNDRMIGMLSGAGTSRTRGFLLSNDGSVVFAVDDGKVSVFHPEDKYISYAQFSLKKSDPKSPLYTELQRRVEQGESGKDEDWQSVTSVIVLRSTSAKDLTLAYNAGEGQGCGVATIDLESNKVSDNKALFQGGPKQTIYAAFPDASTNQVIMDTATDGSDRSSRSFFALLDGKKLRDTRPGWAPMLLDTKNNHFYSYLYSESGFPFGVNIEPVTGLPKDEEIGFPEDCMLYTFSRLPTGQLIAFFAPRDEDKDNLAGTYLWEESAKKWKKVNSFELDGTSADGSALLFSDRVYRKSWVVMAKPS